MSETPPAGDPLPPDEESERVGERLKLDIGAASIASPNHHKNEDAYFLGLSEKIKVVGVFDGVGGQSSGDLASRTASESIESYLCRELENKPPTSLKRATKAVRQALLEANDRVLKEQKEKGNKMCSTASVVVIWEEGGKRKAIIGNAGDSRVYLAGDGGLEQVTLDDNKGLQIARGNERHAREFQKRLGSIENEEDVKNLNRKERQLFKERNAIVKVVGMRGLEPNVTVVDLEPGVRLIVCSDGIHDNLTDKEMQTILNDCPDAQTAASNLVKNASLRADDNHHVRSKPDDMTAIVVDIPRELVGITDKQEESIRSAKTMEELFMVLDTWEGTGLRGSGKTFTTEELKTIIKAVQEGKSYLYQITRAGGLRKKVQELLGAT